VKNALHFGERSPRRIASGFFVSPWQRKPVDERRGIPVRTTGASLMDPGLLSSLRGRLETLMRDAGGVAMSMLALRHALFFSKW